MGNIDKFEQRNIYAMTSRNKHKLHAVVLPVYYKKAPCGHICVPGCLQARSQTCLYPGLKRVRRGFDNIQGSIHVLHHLFALHYGPCLSKRAFMFRTLSTLAPTKATHSRRARTRTRALIFAKTHMNIGISRIQVYVHTLLACNQ